MKASVCLAATFALLGSPASGAEETLTIPIDAVFETTNLWDKTAAEIEEAWKPKGFRWVSAETKDRGIIRRENRGPVPFKLQAFGKFPVEEVNFVFKQGKLAEVSMLPWNKGDSENATLSQKQFEAIVEGWSGELNRRIAPSFQDRGKDTASAAKAERRLWAGDKTLAQLEFSGGRSRERDPYTGRERSGSGFEGEFIRLRLMPRPASMVGLNTSTGGTAAVKRADLVKSVVREDSGDVYIANIPMVDQGDKGYCAAATAARVFNYYGIPADQHEMAQVSGNEAGGGGTNPDEMEDAMRRIAVRYKTRYQTILDLDYTSRKYERFMRNYNAAARKLDKKQLDTDNYIYAFGGLDPDVLREVNGKGRAYESFMREVRSSVDKGIPVMWGLQLGLFPETGLKARQLNGGHMRLIIGYNLAKEEILFSDSWGAGHERKRMAAPDASAATMGLYVLQPAN